MDVIIPTNLVCVLFGPPIPTSSFNFIAFYGNQGGVGFKLPKKDLSCSELFINVFVMYYIYGISGPSLYTYGVYRLYGSYSAECVLLTFTSSPHTGAASSMLASNETELGSADENANVSALLILLDKFLSTDIKIGSLYCCIVKFQHHSQRKLLVSLGFISSPLYALPPHALSFDILSAPPTSLYFDDVPPLSLYDILSVPPLSL